MDGLAAARLPIPAWPALVSHLTGNAGRRAAGALLVVARLRPMRLVAERTPYQDKYDLFRRETRPGFDGWGREHGKFDLVA
jgi:hypothetical protein